MVFESVITDVLNRFLGDYIENLDAKQLKLGIWGGDVVLKDLHLKQHALKDLDLPVQTIYGRLDKLVVKIPWHNLYGAAVEVTIEGLYLLLSPNNEIAYDAEKEEHRAWESKKGELQKIEDRKKLQEVAAKTDDTFVEKLVTQIIKNVQLSIKNIHVRYEDKSLGAPFAMGCTLSDLVVQTTDEFWKPTVVHEMAKKIYKIVTLEGLSVYWNCGTTMFSELPIEDRREAFLQDIANKEFKPVHYKYILGPINSDTRLILNPKPEHETPPFNNPKAHAELKIETLSVGISMCQYRDIVAFADSMQMQIKGMPYRKYRPHLPYDGHAKDWWQFAFTCIIETEVKRKKRNWDWDHMCDHRKICKRYGDLYKTKLTSKKLAKETQDELTHCEKDLDMYNLVLIRQRISMEVEMLDKMRKDKQPKGWFSGWFGSSAKTDDDEETQNYLKRFQEAMTPDEKKKLFAALDYNENDAPTAYPATYIDTIVKFSLNEFKFNIRNDVTKLKSVVKLKLIDVRSSIERRPKNNGLKVAGYIGNMLVTGVEQNDIIPELVSSKMERTAGDCLVDLIFEMNPMDMLNGNRVQLSANPLKVIYDAVTILEIINVFKVPPSSALEELSHVTASQFNDIKEKSALGLQNVIEKHPKLDICIKFSAPIVLIPHEGLYTGGENVLVINLGTLAIKSLLNTDLKQVHTLAKSGFGKDEVMNQMILQSYDRFQIDLTAVQVLIAQSDEKWIDKLLDAEVTPMHILRPINISVLLETCIVNNDPHMPLSKISAEVPSIFLRITDARLLLVLSLVDSLAKQFSEEQGRITRSVSTSSLRMISDMSEKAVKKRQVPITATHNAVQMTVAHVKFVLQEFRFSFAHQETVADPSIDVINLALKTLTSEFTERTYTRELRMGLWSIQMKQYINNETVHIIDTMDEGNKELFKMEFLQVNVKNPEFNTTYNKTLSQLLVDFATVDLILHHAALVDLMRYATEIQNITSDTSVEVVHRSRARRTSSASSVSMVMKTAVAALEMKQPQKRKEPTDHIQFKLKANLEKIIVNFYHTEPLSKFSIAGLNTYIALTEEQTKIIAYLSDITVLDLNKKTAHSVILSVDEMQKAIEVSVKLFNNPTSEETDIAIKATLGRVRISFVYWYISNMLNFVNSFTAAQEAIIAASQKAAQAAKDQMENIYEKATKISLDIQLKAPEIIIPEKSTSLTALHIDLGQIFITNKFNILQAQNEKGHYAIVDEMQLKLVNLSMHSIELSKEMTITAKVPILQPLSFILEVNRNLSHWYTAIPSVDVNGVIDNIQILLGQTDYATIMNILNENMNEGQICVYEETVNVVVSDDITMTESRLLKTMDSATTQALITESDASIKTNVRWNFTMHLLKINLYNVIGGPSTTLNFSMDAPKTRIDLAELSMEGFLAKGRMLSNNSISNSLLLMNLVLSDTRPNREGNITQLLYRTPFLVEQGEEVENESILNENRNMVDMTFQTRQSDTFIDLRVYSFTFLLSMEYLLKLSNFFQQVTDTNKPPPKKQTLQLDKRKIEEATSTNSMISIALKLEKPDVILVENIDDANTRALVLNFELLTKLRIVGEKQSINGTLADLQMYTCMFNPEIRESTKNMFLEPCTLSIAGSTPDECGLHIEAYFTDILIGVSVCTIELVSNILSTISATGDGKKSTDIDFVDRSTLWNTRENGPFWFLQTDEAEDALSYKYVPVTSLDRRNKQKTRKEMCLLHLPQLIITLQAGAGYKTFPILAMESTFRGQVNNWSSQLYVEATLSLQMGYYNNLLALWEPLIEPITLEPEELGQEPTVVPWEINLEVNMNGNNEVKEEQQEIHNLELDLIEFTPQPAMTVDISSSNNLELTLTKTGLDVLTNMGKMFAAATTVTSSELRQDEVTSLYKVVNTTGIDIVLQLDTSELALKDNATATTIILQKDSEVYLDPVEDLGSSKVSSFCNYISELKEKYLKVEVPKFNMTLSLPYLRAVSRYYRIPETQESGKLPQKSTWGLVSSVNVVNGISIITLSSILEVFNCFNVPVDIYYMRHTGNELKCIATIQPGTSLHLPVQAVYSLTSELFFSVEGYSVTTTPYVWKDLQLNVAVNKNLMCSSKKELGKSFVIKVVGEMKQIFYENTTKHTMSSTKYKIHLRPAVIFKNCLPYEILLSVTEPTGIPIPPGNTLEVPNVDPGHTEVTIKLPDYLDKTWVCKKEIPSIPPQFSVWTLDSYESITKMSLDLGLHCLNVDGTYTMSLYCPFWMINKTGLILSYRTTDEHTNVLYHPATFKDPILFSFNARNFFGKKKACVKVGQGDWCEKFSIDVAGSSGVIMCTEKDKNYQIGVHNALTYNGLTKMITYTPYYVIINQSNFTMECQEDKRSADPWITAAPKSCSAFWPISESEDKLIRVKMEGTNEITIPFLITESHTTLVKLKNKFGGINVDIQLTEGAVYINLTLYDNGMAPALIINSTAHTLNIWEKKSVHINKLPSGQNMFFTWDYPSSDRVLVWEGGYKAEIENELRMDDVGNYEVATNVEVYWVSFLDGMQRVLLFTSDPAVAQNAQSSKQIEIIDREITVSLYGMGLSIVNNMKRQEIMYIGIASTGIIWETCKLSGKRYKQMSTAANIAVEKNYQQYLLRSPDTRQSEWKIKDMEIDFSQNLQLKPRMRKIRRIFQTGIWLQMKTSQHQMQLHAKINRLQIDNQLFDCTFPVMLAPVPPPKSVVVTDANKPFAEVSIVQLLIKNSQIQQYKYFKVLIQEFHVKVDLGFINAIMECFDTSIKTDEEEKEYFLQDIQRVNDPLYSHASQISQQEQKSFYDLLHFSPLKIHVSFSMTQGQGAGIGNIPVFLSVLLQGIGVTLTDMQDVIFKLAYFEREYSFLTQKQLMSEATKHYVGQTVKQLYVLVLGLDVIGNPYGLVLGITKGVEDLFYEPFQGAIQGPGEFAEGLAFGVASLFGHTFGGAAGAVSRITGAMGKGIAALSFDKEYQRKRRDQINKRPATVKEGLARGGKGLVMGVFDGVTGVFTKPISGAKEQGIGGFFKGLGKGAVGLVARPTAGVMDFASSSLESVKRATEFGSAYVIRLRPPRFVPHDRLVKPFNPILANGNKLLCELEKGKYYSTDIYSCHFTVIEKKEVLLLSDKRIAYIVHNDLFGGWQVDWTHTWEDLDREPIIVNRGVQIFFDTTKKRFKSNENTKIILISHEAICQRIVNEISKHVKLHNRNDKYLDTASLSSTSRA